MAILTSFIFIYIEVESIDLKELSHIPLRKSVFKN